jgi:uncharacterized protein (DUF885 family)
MKNAFKISLIFLIVFPIFCETPGSSPGFSIGKLNHEYIEKWQQFYPSQALAAGDIKAAHRFENLSSAKIREWLQYNQSVRVKLDGHGTFDALSLDDHIDARFLKRQVLLEIEKWHWDRVHEHSPAMYAEMISQAMTHILARNQLQTAETLQAVSNRLKGISNLCRKGIGNLKNGSPHRTLQSVAQLENSAEFYEKKLREIATIQKWLDPGAGPGFQKKTVEAANMIRKLAAHIKLRIIPNMTLPDAMGKKNYSRKLKIYTDSSLTPKRLETLALEEIKTVREMMTWTAGEYLQTRHPGQEQPADSKLLLKEALLAMEAHREKDQQSFLKQFKELIRRSVEFVRQKEIATLPGKLTLFTALSPAHFSGAAVGGVYPSGPFNPEADTLFYLPTVPDTAPQGVRDGFYRSFNNHFNAMIISHEIVPGHYMQLKLAALNPHKVRGLFAGELYVEGWGSFSEQIMLTEGWDDGNPLTLLAHLRKRLENAVRAYTSVKVHCDGWTKDQLTRFAVEKGLLPPQFAANLWNRAMNSPQQLTSYFLGFRAFLRLFNEEKKRLGRGFNLKKFCDSILRSSAAPIDLLPELVK